MIRDGGPTWNVADNIDTVRATGHTLYVDETDTDDDAGAANDPPDPDGRFARLPDADVA